MFGKGLNMEKTGRGLVNQRKTGTRVVEKLDEAEVEVNHLGWGWRTDQGFALRPSLYHSSQVPTETGSYDPQLRTKDAENVRDLTHLHPLEQPRSLTTSTHAQVQCQKCQTVSNLTSRREGMIETSLR